MDKNKMHPLDVALEASIGGNPNLSEEILRSESQADYRVLFNLGWHEMQPWKHDESV